VEADYSAHPKGQWQSTQLFVPTGLSDDYLDVDPGILAKVGLMPSDQKSTERLHEENQRLTDSCFHMLITCSKR